MPVAVSQRLSLHDHDHDRKREGAMASLVFSGPREHGMGHGSGTTARQLASRPTKPPTLDVAAAAPVSSRCRRASDDMKAGHVKMYLARRVDRHSIDRQRHRTVGQSERPPRAQRRHQPSKIGRWQYLYAIELPLVVSNTS